MVESHATDILLFGSQGSNSHFDVDAGDIEKTSPAARQTIRDFLASCFEALQDELKNLTEDQRATIGPWVYEQIDRPGALLNPPTTSRSSPVVESLSLYLHQIIDLVCYNFYGDGRSTLETVGVCSGMIPAVLAAAFPSSTSEEFLDYAIDGFRLTFWIGVRTLLFSDCHSTRRVHGPWALTVRGLSVQQTQEKLEVYNRNSHSEPPLRISAIIDDTLLSLVGETSNLNAFRETLPPGITTRYPHIHGYFHGGPVLHSVVSEILSDVDGLGIRFPTWSMLKTSIRSVTTGELLELSDSKSLLRVVLDHIFIQHVDWRMTWNAILKHWGSNTTEQDIRIVKIGPNTSSLRLGSRLAQAKPAMDCVTTTSLATIDQSAGDIAIVGMSANFPSGSDKKEFWETLRAGASTVSEIPSSRFDNSVYYSSDHAKTKDGRRTRVKHGNFLDDPFAFDNAFFNISPREAKSMDPQQRLLLHASLDALEDAGYQPDATATFQKESFGVFVGAATGDYVDNLRDQPDVYYSPGTLRAFLSGRISYVFGFKGPSMVVDTACSSSLVAIHQACRAIRNGDCTAALAGGVNVISSPDMYLGLARAHFLSETGQCKPFDQGADGYCRAEGCGVVVLKRLAEAMDEGDRILGVIRGVEVNQCGDATSITHPNSGTQSSLFRELLKNSGVGSDMISVVEAHGTGTQAGDMAENRSLRTVFESQRPPDSPVYLGSVKGNIGHAEAASGMAGLIKLLMMLEHKQIPPQASLTKVNPKLDIITDGKVTVPTQLSPWKARSGRRRLALLNNFGAAGSNAALLLQEAPERPKRPRDRAHRSCHVLNVSARTESALETLRSQYASLLNSVSQDMEIASFCYSANARRIEHDAFRLSVVGKTKDDILARLLDDAVVSRSTLSHGKVVFVFSGQGGIHSGMGAELLQSCPEFSTKVRACDKILKSQGFPATWPYLSGDPGNQSGDLDAYSHIVLQQCACFVVEYALAWMWMGFGVIPDMVAGHSLGEYAALTVAGVITLHDAMSLVAKRADLMARMCDHGASGMIACRLSSASAQDLISTSSSLGQLSISCENGPQDTVVSGPIHELSAFAELARSTGARVTPVEVPFAYHSEAMEPLMETYSAELSSVSLKPPRIPVGSGLRGRIFTPHEQIDSMYLAEHCRQPVKFEQLTDQISRAFDAPKTEIRLLEIGPSPTTISKMKWAFSSESCSLLPSLKPKETPWTTISTSLRALYLQGHRINWRQVYAGSEAQFLFNTVRYPMDRSTFVVPYTEKVSSATTVGSDSVPQSPRTKLPFDFLDRILRDEGSKTVFQACTPAIAPFIKSHIVGGVPLCPASIFVELAMQVAEIVDTSARSSFRTFSDLSFKSPLVTKSMPTPDTSLVVETTTTSSPGHLSFEAASSQGVHCSSTLNTTPSAVMDDLRRRKAAYVRRQILNVFSSEAPPSERFSNNTIYNVIFPRVVSYSGDLVTLKSLKVSPSGLEGHGVFQLPPLAPKDEIVSHPALVDTLLHAAGFIANATADAGTAYICSHIEKIIVPTGSFTAHSEQLEVYCSLVDIDHSIVTDAYALNGAGDVIAWVEGCVFKKLALRSFEAHLNKLHRETKDQKGTKKNETSSQTADTQGRPAPRSPPRSKKPNGDTQQVPQPSLFESIRQICGLSSNETLSSNTALSNLGIDSLLLIELGDLLHQSLNCSEGVILDLSACETIGDLEQIVAEAGATVDDSDAPELTATESCSEASFTETPAEIPAATKRTTSGSASDGVREVFRDVFGLDISGLSKSTAISSLGVDSLGSMELLDVLQERFGLDTLGGHGTISELTLEEMEKLLYSAGSSSTFPETPNNNPGPSKGFNGHAPRTEAPREKSQAFPKPIGIHKPANTPLYLFHDGSGKCNMYEKLQIVGYNLFGVYSVDFDMLNPDLQTLEELASLYIIRANLKNVESVALGGWSFGGVLAFEVGRQLKQLGKDIPHIVLIDSPFPIGHDPLPQAVISHIVGGTRRSSPTRDALASQFTRHAQMLQHYNPTPHTGDMKCTMIHCTREFDTEALCGVSYPWLCSPDARLEALRAWLKFLGRPMRVLDLDSDHFQVFHVTNLDKTSLLIQKALDGV